MMHSNYNIKWIFFSYHVIERQRGEVKAEGLPLLCRTVSTDRATHRKSTKSRDSNFPVQIQIIPKSQFEIVPRDTEESEFFDLVDFDVAFSVETVISPLLAVTFVREGHIFFCFPLPPLPERHKETTRKRESAQWRERDKGNESKILYHCFLLLDQFRFCEKHILLHISGSWPIGVRLVHSWAGRERDK